MAICAASGPMTQSVNALNAPKRDIMTPKSGTAIATVTTANIRAACFEGKDGREYSSSKEP